MTGSYKSFIYLLIGLFVIIISFSYWKVQQDDAYIFYTYAKNIMEGNGYVLNIGDKLNATTSPLYTVLLALLSLIFRAAGLSIPVAAHFIGAVSLFFHPSLYLEYLTKEIIHFLPYPFLFYF